MNRTRWAALAVVVAVLAVGGAAWGVTAATDGGADGQEAAAVDDSTTTSERPTTTQRPTTTSTTAPPTTTTAPPVDDVLERGDRGEAVAALQRRLTELRYDPGPADGAFGLGTMYAVQAFQKVHGMGPDGKVGRQVQMALAAPTSTSPLIPNGGGDRIEVDLRTQLLTVYKGGELRLITHVSTGSGESYCVEGDCGNKAITPVGGFRFKWRYPGWRESRLGKLYNPVYFTNRGHAVHGSTSVPTYPASHGCVRIPMHIAEYFPSLVDTGDPIYVLDGKKEVGPTAEAPSGPPPSDPPPSPETTTPTSPPPEQTTPTTTEPTPPTTIVP
jgi:peptidoglycan hydrolase-like protein with peptidoglycan-binding domain